MSNENLLIALVTVPTESEASHIAKELVERKLAACVNIVPGLRSIYRWQGSVEDSSELLLVIKTTELRYQELERAVVELHPYDTPEVLALPIAAGFSAYCQWIRSETKR